MLVITNAPQAFAPILTRLETDAASYFAGPIRLAPAGEEERPFSYLLRLAVCRPEEITPFAHLFVKVFKLKSDMAADAMRQRVLQDYETNARVHAVMMLHDDVGVVPPVVCYPELLTIVTEEVSGPTLLEHLHAHAAWFVGSKQLNALDNTMKTTGCWLRAFQATGSGGLAPVDQFRAYIDHRLQRLVNSDPARLGQGDRERILRHVDALAAAIGSDELREVAVHSDLALGNILVSDARIVVLDFAMAKLGTRLHDLTRLWVQLDLLKTKPRFRAATVQRLQRALVNGYDPAVAPDRPLFRLLVLLHRVNQLAKLAGGRARFPQRAYNRLVQWHHWRWIAGELSAAPAGDAR